MTTTSHKSGQKSNKVNGYVDLVAHQDKRLMEQENSKIEFLRSIQPPGMQETFGMKSKTRDEEPSMNEIFSWGYEAPIMNDYTKNKAEISNKIRKMKRPYISENHDNFRKPEGPVDVNEQFLFNYFDLEEIELFKRKLYEKATTEEREIRNLSMYKEFFSRYYKDQEEANQLLAQKLREIETWTPAGKASGQPYTKFGVIQRPITSPVDLNWQKLEAKLREMGFTAETVAAAAAAYEEERQRTLESKSQSKLNADLQQTDRQEVLEIEEGDAGNKKRPKSAALKKLQQADLLKRMNDLKLQGRLLPDSALTTYFGKPAFHTYGNGNTRPTNGGLLYGSYLKTHNINPHSGDNKPEHIQIYGHAMMNPTVFVNARSSFSKSPKKNEKTQEQLQKAQADRFTRFPQPPRVPKCKRPITAAMLKVSDEQFPVEPEPLKRKQNRPIKKPTLKADPNLENLVTEDGHIMSGTSIGLNRQVSASKRSAMAGRENIPSTRNSAALGGDSARVMRFDDEVLQQQQSEGGDKQSLAGRENQENTEKNYQEPSEAQETLATEKDRARTKTNPFKKVDNQMTVPLDEFIRALQSAMPETTASMIGPQAPESLDLRNPKNYKYLHAKYLQSIKLAGKQTPASVHVGDLNGFKIAAVRGK